jgi:hypothetical protein
VIHLTAFSFPTFRMAQTGGISRRALNSFVGVECKNIISTSRIPRSCLHFFNAQNSIEIATPNYKLFNSQKALTLFQISNFPSFRGPPSQGRDRRRRNSRTGIRPPEFSCFGARWIARPELLLITHRRSLCRPQNSDHGTLTAPSNRHANPCRRPLVQAMILTTASSRPYNSPASPLANPKQDGRLFQVEYAYKAVDNAGYPLEPWSILIYIEQQLVFVSKMAWSSPLRSS